MMNFFILIWKIYCRKFRYIVGGTQKKMYANISITKKKQNMLLILVKKFV